ncbi:integrase, catalytic region, zinc finger, CCHC-type containing protein [Tanacetum coccineum]
MSCSWSAFVLRAVAQCYNCGEKGHYAKNCPKPRVRDSKYFMEQMLLAKQDEAGVILIDEQNDFLFADALRMEEIEELTPKTKFSKKATQSKTLDTTSVASKSKIDEASASKLEISESRSFYGFFDSGCSKHMTGDRSLRLGHAPRHASRYL